MKQVKMVVVLTIICAAAAALLQAVAAYTAPIIAMEEKKFELRSVSKAIQETGQDPCRDSKPAYDNSPDEDSVCVDGVKVYRGKKGDSFVGFAFESVGRNSYSGEINVLVALSPEGSILGTEILRHSETPGLGSKIENCPWRKQFLDRKAGGFKWAVVKDGGEVDQISGATISSRSMIDAITRAFEFFEGNKSRIIQGKPMKPGEVCNAR